MSQGLAFNPFNHPFRPDPPPAVRHRSAPIERQAWEGYLGTLEPVEPHAAPADLTPSSQRFNDYGEPVYVMAESTDEAAAAGAGAAVMLISTAFGLAWTTAAIYGTYKWFTRKDCLCGAELYRQQAPRAA